MNAYRWRNGPRQGQYLSLRPTDYVVKVATPLNAFLWGDHKASDLVELAYIECQVDHECHEIIWPDDNWRGYWTDERPMRVYQSYTISNDDYIKKDQIMLDLESETRRMIRNDYVVSYRGKWVMWNPKAPLHARRWQFVAKERPVYCDHRMHGPNSVDARWYCPSDHPDCLFERK